MNKKTTLSFALLSTLLLSVCTALGPVHAYTEIVVPHQDHMIVESVSEPETVDPAWAYDTASEELILNVYEPLINFDREHTNEFVPALAKQWTNMILPTPVTITLADGMTHNDGSGQSREITYLQKLAFDIRVGAPFHRGGFLTMEDVEYSFERLMVQDRSGGPTWMITEPTMGYGVYHVDPNDPLQDELIDYAFRINPAGIYGSNTFEIWLQTTYPPILGILAQPWGSIVHKDFMAAAPVNDWPHDWGTWTSYHDPATAPVDVAGNVMDGTGPYKLDYWTHGVEWSIVKFDGYWGDWPYKYASGSLNRATWRVVYEWSTRLADFRAGVVDTVYVPRAYIAQVEGWPGIRGIKDLPTLSTDAMFFNFDIDPVSPYVGTGQFDANLDGVPDGIPLNFFSDPRIRKGFAYLFDYAKFIHEVWLDEAVQPSSPVLEGIPYHIDVDKYCLDITKATQLFQEASNDPSSPAYQVMVKGFYMKITYPTANAPRQVAADILKTNALLVNQKFKIDTLAVPWSTYLGELWWYPTFKSIMTIFQMGWQADYPDPHDSVWPFMHSQGTLAYPSSYSNPAIDALIEGGIATPDGPPRAAIYGQLQWMYYQEIPSVCLAQPFGRHWERDWVQGWYYNPVYGGSLWAESLSLPPFYHMWKGLNGDVNGDHVVDILDAAELCAWWYWPPVFGVNSLLYGYNVKYDIGPYLQYQVGMLPPPGVSVGIIDIFDLAVINAHWGEWKAPLPPTPPPVPNAAIIAAPEVRDQSLTPCKTFSIDITIANVSAMWGYQFTLGYDTNILTATGYAPYPPFTLELPSEINDPEGYISLAFGMDFGALEGLSTLEPYPIARIDFHVQKLGESVLDLTDTKIVDIQGKYIPHMAIDGYFSNLPPAIPVTIDIKPGSYPNSIGLDDKGLLPVAVLGSATFDVETIVPNTLQLGGVDIYSRGSAKAPKIAYSIEDANGDFYLDMVAFFSVSELVELGALTSTTTQLKLTGNLFDGTPIAGTDTVVPVPPK